MATHVAVLPQELLDVLRINLPALESDDATRRSFLRLPHPRTGLTALFFGLDDKIVEVQAVVTPNSRSWFIEEEVVADGKMTLMTPIDPVFLLIPLLQAIQPTEGSASAFRQAEDIFETAAQKIHDVSLVEDVNRLGSFACVRNALRRMCETKDVTHEIVVFRYSQEQTLEYLRRKVARLAVPSLLEISRTTMRQLSKDALLDGAGDDIIQAGRTKAACDIVGQYLPSEMLELLLSSYDFSKLNTHLTNIRLMEPDLVAAPDMPKDRKRKAPKADENPKGADKKKKVQKDSSGVEKLKKVNVNGMAKLSTFFKKA